MSDEDTRGCVIEILTRGALRERGHVIDREYMVVVDSNDDGQKTVSVDTIAALRSLIPTLCPTKILYFCTPAERDELRSIALAIQASHEFIDSLRRDLGGMH